MESREAVAQAVGEIAQWSLENFKEQEGDGLRLGRVAPLLGIFEEIYEYLRADCQQEALDALGDILIFMVDYLSRCGKSPEEIADMILCSDIDQLVSAPSNKCMPFIKCLSLARHELKRVQGIRGYADDTFYATMRDASIRNLINIVRVLLQSCSPFELDDALLLVWNRVKHRNWRANPENGSA